MDKLFTSRESGVLWPLGVTALNGFHTAELDQSV